ncbi:cytochrome b-c1 complex subunit 9, mitochondrial [Purpureocillium lavendulum]|uniref:Cytochrome b-c1 complex subunit 9, mitochondrial n=1 Tax=Purpureocillium lavendulum TaxID=1247861 RepID=A0AB34G4S7_9HYPO|nr:cytochrome b-c1 complex subunit 9, mitochondrial [Purpureocillium lavendulum]
MLLKDFGSKRGHLKPMSCCLRSRCGIASSHISPRAHVTWRELSHFVSGGKIGPSGEPYKDESGKATPQEGQQQQQQQQQQQKQQAPQPLAKNVEWEAVQKELDAERKRREEARHKAAAGEEKSLYEILQANKEAKQAAFEEQNRLKNQFRALDDDEVKFLDDVRARQQREEEAVRRATEEGLRAFRERQKSGGGGGEEEALAAAEGLGDAGDEEEWGATAGRKRKRAARERDGLKGVRRRTSDGAAAVAERDKGGGDGGGTDVKAGAGAQKADKKKDGEAAKEPAKKASALVDYGSDDSDE